MSRQATTPPRPRCANPLADRFWSKVACSSDDECWPFVGWICKGYGRISVAGTASYAHRLAWQLRYGPIPAGLCVLHRCDNPPCCNPAHLFVGTNADNVADRNAKGRQSRGEHRPSAKLSAAEVIEIRAAIASGRGIGSTAKSYGVTKGTVAHIVHRRTWGHIE